MATKDSKYFEGLGRRKTSIARVRITPDTKAGYTINDKDFATHFPTKALQETVNNPFVKSGIEQKFKVSVEVKGGGISSQAGAVSLGIARALTQYDIHLRGALKKEGLLKRDARAKERRKFGLKKARKAPQWSKR
ncbi:MAG TPA: 30S ribosomal protein S9 [Candidatus Paceibacterota bacterium]|nr:30S ribosomal protein S9 [Candidatus Paceibacterota bacterium]